MRPRTAALAVLVLGSFAVMVATGAVLTTAGKQSLTLTDVLVPGAIPIVVLIAVTVLARARPADGPRRGDGKSEAYRADEAGSPPGT